MLLPLSSDVELSPNRRAQSYVHDMINRSVELRLTVTNQSGATVIDCGVHSEGGFEAGLLFSKICLGGLADVRLVWQDFEGLRCPALEVTTDHPVRACMASQYAGWTIRCGGRSYIGSGPACAVACKGSLFKLLGYKDDTNHVILCLESGRLPTEEVVDLVSEVCCVESENITILVAPTNSAAGTVQVAARALETALFKLRRVGYDLGRIVSGAAVCPISPVAGDKLSGLGRTNDAISYGGTAWVNVRDSDERLAEIIGQIPASAAPGYGLSYSEYEQDHGSAFNRGPDGFNPAVIWMSNLDTGHSWTAGELRPDVLRRSFDIN